MYSSLNFNLECAFPIRQEAANSRIERKVNIVAIEVCFLFGWL